MKNQKRLPMMKAVSLLLCLCLLVSGCRGNTGLETNPVETNPVNVAYTVSVQTEGGMALEGVGVYIYTDSTKSELVWFDRTNAEGKMTFSDAVCQGYYAFLSQIPEGYLALEEGYPITGETTQIILSADMDGADENAVYELGSVMQDFTVTAVDGTEYTLSELLKEKKAVVLNFFYNECQPCRNEFPYLQEAYIQNGDIEVLALNPVNTDAAAIAALQKELELSFPVAQADPAWEEQMQLTAYPTTVIIDRFGTVALIHKGSVPDAKTFADAFTFFTAEDYTQTVVEDITELYIEEGPNPKDVTGMQSYELVLQPGEEITYQVYKINNMLLRMEGEDGYVIYDGKTHTTDKGVSFVVKCKDNFTPAELTFGNSGTEEQTYKVRMLFRSGTWDNPLKLELGEFSTKCNAGNDQGVYYRYTATEDGVLTLECLDVTSGVDYQYILYNLSTAAYITSESDGGINEATGNPTVSLLMKKGQSAKISLGTMPDKNNNYPSATIKTLATFTAGDGGAEEEEIVMVNYAVTVKDSAGNPMADVKMKLVGEPLEDQSAVTEVFTTGADGVASGELRSGSYTVTLTVPAGYTADKSDFTLTAEASTAQVTLSKVVVTRVDYKVTVLYPSGAPVENVMVIIGSSFGTTGADGSVTVNLEKGEYAVYLSSLPADMATDSPFYTLDGENPELTVTLISTAEEPTEPTEPEVTEPTEPEETEPTEPEETEPTEPEGTEPTEPEETEPTEPEETEPTEPEETEPTEPEETEPTEPEVTEPTEPEETEPTEPEETDPTEPEETEPTEPEETEPTEPEETDTAVYKITVTDYAKTPAVGTMVAIFDSGNSLVATGVTDANGTVSIRLERGNYTVSLLGSTAYYEKSKAVLSASQTEVFLLLAAEPSETDDIWKADNGQVYLLSEGGTHVVAGEGQFGYGTEDAVTFFAFMPTRAGIYRLTTSNPNVPISFWNTPFYIYNATNNLGSYVNNAFTLTVQEANLGVVYMLGIVGEAECALEITWLGEPGYDPAYQPYEQYVGTITPTKFKYTGGTLTNVDVTGKTENYVLVYNETDGYYHLGGVNGPVVYVRLTGGGAMINLDLMINGDGVAGGTDFRAAYYDQYGNYCKESYGNLINQYLECLTGSTTVYPLNKDLYYVIQKGVSAHGWADPESGNFQFAATENFNKEIGWMFLLCYEAK